LSLNDPDVACQVRQPAASQTGWASHRPWESFRVQLPTRIPTRSYWSWARTKTSLVITIELAQSEW